MPEALYNLRKTFKEEYGLDVDATIWIYSWPSTHHLASLVCKELIKNYENWTYDSNSYPSSFSKGEKQTMSYSYKVHGVRENRGLSFNIYMQDDQKKRRLPAVPKQTKKMSQIAQMVSNIHLLGRELYAAEIDINIEAKVEKAISIFDRNHNPEITIERATEILSNINSAGKWTMSDHLHDSSVFPTRNLAIKGLNFETRIHFSLPRKESLD